MKVTIDNVEYVPASEASKGADEKALAIIRMLISGYYTFATCHCDGQQTNGTCHQAGEDCFGCKAYRIARNFVGPVESKEEPIIEAMWRDL